MKKIILITTSIILILFLSGCSKNLESVKKVEEPKEEKITCIIYEDNSNLKQQYSFEAKNNIINHIILSITYNQVNGIENFSTFTEDQKLNFESIMLNAMGLEKTKNPGLEVKMDFNEQLTVTIDADLEIANEELLKSVGLDAETIDLDYKNTIEDLKNSGATCQ